MQTLNHYIAGSFLTHGTKALPVLNPFTEETIAEISEATPQDLDAAVLAARNAFTTRGKTTPMERSNLLLKLADALEINKEHLASLESQNQGKLLSVAKADIDFGIDNLKFFAGACRTMQTQAPGKYGQGFSMLTREPFGVVAAITPWNYPIMMACRKLAAVAAGNTIILKPSSLTPLTTIELAKLATQVGFPAGVINVLLGSGDNMGPMLAQHPGIDVLAFTGSTAVGAQLNSRAAPSLKKVNLELGGKAPFIVFDDADLEKASQYALDASIINGGQDCTAATRVYVHKSIYEKFIDMVVEKANKVILGDPSDPKTGLGPLVSRKQVERVMGFLNNLEGNETIVYQSSIPTKGFFAPLTVIRDLQEGSMLCTQEVFGPVIAFGSFANEPDAIAKANAVDYGLASSVRTNDVTMAMRVAQSLTFGETRINDHLPLVSEMPHGGAKRSGHGVDLGMNAVEEYTRLKHVYVG